MIFHAWYLRNCTPAPTSHVSQHMFVLLRTHQQCRRPLVHQLSGRAAVRQLQQRQAAVLWPVKAMSSWGGRCPGVRLREICAQRTGRSMSPWMMS